MLTNLPVPYDHCAGVPILCLLTVGSTSVQHSDLNVKALIRHFQPGKGPNRGLLRDCENRLWNRWIICSISYNWYVSVRRRLDRKQIWKDVRDLWRWLVQLVLLLSFYNSFKYAFSQNNSDKVDNNIPQCLRKCGLLLVVEFLSLSQATK